MKRQSEGKREDRLAEKEEETTGSSGSFFVATGTVSNPSVQRSSLEGKEEEPSTRPMPVLNYLSSFLFRRFDANVARLSLDSADIQSTVAEKLMD